MVEDGGERARIGIGQLRKITSVADLPSDNELAYSPVGRQTSPFGICRMPASTSSPGSVPVGAPFTWAAPAPWAHPTPPQIPLGRLCSRPRPLGG
jgi:hypothetical protein